MSRAGKYLRRASGGMYFHHCPACDRLHGLKVADGAWSFNERLDAPSFNPSIRVSTTEGDPPVDKTLCHYFVRTGAELIQMDCTLDIHKSYVHFCADSPHALAGRIVPLPQLPEDLS